MQYTELNDFLSEQAPEPLRLTVNGKTYEFEASAADLPATIGLRLTKHRTVLESIRQRIQAGDETALAEPELTVDYEAQIARTLLPGITRQQMTDDGCTTRQIEHVESTLLIHYMYGAEIGRLHWEGKLGQLTESLGETLGQTGNS